MSRRTALATIASGATTLPAQATPSLAVAADPALVAYQRCLDAQFRYAEVSKYAARTGNLRIEEEAGEVYNEIAWDLIETSATTPAGIIAKLKEMFDDEIKDAPPNDMGAATLVSVIEDLERMERMRRLSQS